MPTADAYLDAYPSPRSADAFLDDVTPDEKKKLSADEFLGPEPTALVEQVPPQVQDIIDQSKAQQAIERNPDVPQWANNAAVAAMETASGFIPRTVGQAAEMVTPVASLPHDLKQTIGAVKDWMNGKPIDEINKDRFPESQILIEAEKTPPGSKERFSAGFNVIAQMLMAKGIAGQLGRAGLGSARDSRAGEGNQPGRTSPPSPPELTAAETRLPVENVAPPEFNPAAAQINAAEAAKPIVDPGAVEIANAEGIRAIEAVQRPTPNVQILEEQQGGDPFGFGPGAASAGERLASYEQRRFAERLQQDKTIAAEIRENTGNRYYEPVPNKTTAEQAAEIVNQRGIDQSIKAITDPQSDLPFHVRSTMGQLVIKRLNEGFQRLKTVDPKAADTLLNQATDMAEWQAEFGTALGQGVQSFAMWQALAPEGKLLQLQRATKRSRDRYTAEHGDEVKEIIDKIAPPNLTRTQREVAFRRLFPTNKTARKIKTTETRLLEAARTGLLNEKAFYEIAGDRLGLPKFDRNVAEQVMKLASAVDAAPEGMPKNKAALELSNFIASKKGFDPRDLPTGIYYGNMLSGYNTQLVNSVDTLFNVFSEVNGLAVANPKAATKIYSAALRGFAEGRTDALLTLTSGRMVTDGKWLEVPRLMEIAKFGEKGGVPIRTDSVGGRILKTIAESKPGMILNAWKYVTRLMAASDSIMFRTAKEARMALLADRLARTEGLSGAALDRRVETILGLDEMQTANFEKAAMQEGLAGQEFTLRVQELRELSRKKDARADAADFAGVATYNHAPTGWLGHISKGLEQTLKPFPLAKVVFVPFTRIVANVTNRGLNYFPPTGFYRAWSERPGSDARAAHLARATFGLAGLGVLGTLQATGIIDINGAGPTDSERRKQLEAAGWKPYSLKIGDRYYSYLYTPIGLALSIVGNMTDSFRYKELDQKDVVTRGVYVMSRIGSTVFSQSFLSGLSNLFKALSGAPGDVISSLKNIFAGTVGTATTPTIIRDVQRFFDNKRYRSDTIMGDLLRNTPFAGAVNKPALNAFGEPLEYPASRFISTLKEDPAWRIVVQTGMRVPVPDKYTEMPDGKGGRRRITTDEYYDLLRMTGPKVKQFIESRGDRWNTLTPEMAQAMLSSGVGEIREAALLRLRMKAARAPSK